MKQRRIAGTAIAKAGGGRIGPSRVVAWGVAGALAVVGSGVVAPAVLPAQTPAPLPGRLTVRPHEMATGTKTEKAGDQKVDSLDDYWVYVPPSCVGTKRCPLVVVLHGGGGSATEQLERHRELADKYGMIMLLGTSVAPGRWDVIDYWASQQLTMDPNQQLLVRQMPDQQDPRNIDKAMKQVLRKYAIDPDKIALFGMSDGAAYTLFIGRNNFDVFSRLVAMSPGIPFQGAGPQNTTTKCFLLGGINEGGFFKSSLLAADELRQEGHPVTQALLLRPHQQRTEDYDMMFGWLKDSWGASGATAYAVPRRTVTADSVALLTADAVKKLITFWGRFQGESDDILASGRDVNRTRILVPVNARQLILPMPDLPAMAAKYPAVAADLKAAGLTARQEEDYAVAVISAVASQRAGNVAGDAPAGSALAKNLEFLDAHQSEIRDLENTGMWADQ